jgi:hypothetical protein
MFWDVALINFQSFRERFCLHLQSGNGAVALQITITLICLNISVV